MDDYDHWFARNFARRDASTRNAVRTEFIPRWQQQIEHNRKDAIMLQEHGMPDKAEFVLLENQEIAASIAAAEQRLRDTESYLRPSPPNPTEKPSRC